MTPTAPSAPGETPFALPVRNYRYGTSHYRILDAHDSLIATGFRRVEADAIVAAVNAHYALTCPPVNANVDSGKCDDATVASAVAPASGELKPVWTYWANALHDSEGIANLNAPSAQVQAIHVVLKSDYDELQRSLARLTAERDELRDKAEAASDFIRGCIEAVGYKEQPPAGFVVDTEKMLHMVIGTIEQYKQEASAAEETIAALRAEIANRDKALAEAHDAFGALRAKLDESRAEIERKTEAAAAWGYEQGAQRFIGDPEDLTRTARIVAKEVHAALTAPRDEQDTKRDERGGV